MNTAKKLSIRLEAVGGDKVRQEFKNIGSDGQKAFQRITQVITPANDNLKVLDNTAKAFNNTLKQVASLAGAYLGLRGLTNTFKSIVETNKEFERLSGSLKTVTGSAKAAKEAFTLIEDFATSTPFQLDEIVDSFMLSFRVNINIVIGEAVIIYESYGYLIFDRFSGERGNFFVIIGVCHAVFHVLSGSDSVKSDIKARHVAVIV